MLPPAELDWRLTVPCCLTHQTIWAFGRQFYVGERPQQSAFMPIPPLPNWCRPILQSPKQTAASKFNQGSSLHKLCNQFQQSPRRLSKPTAEIRQFSKQTLTCEGKSVFLFSHFIFLSSLSFLNVCEKQVRALPPRTRLRQLASAP